MAEPQSKLVKTIWIVWLLGVGLAAGYALSYFQYEYRDKSEPVSQPVSQPVTQVVAECPEPTPEAPAICEAVPPLKTADDYLARGIDLWQRGYYTLPVSDVNTAIQLDPTLADAYFYRGWIAHEGYKDQRNTWHSDLKSAIADYSQTIKLDPNHSRAYNNRAVAYVQRGNYTAALPDLQRAVEIDPDYSNANFNLIQVAVNLKKYDIAIQYCRNWEEHERSQPVRACLQVAEDQGDYAFLIAMLDRTLKYYQEINWRSGLFEYYGLRGHAYLEWEHYPEALASLEQAVNVGEQDILSQYVIKNTSIFDIYLDIVKVYVAQDDAPRALSELSKLILEYPEKPDPYRMRADLYYEQGSYAQALVDYYQAQKLQDHPDDEVTGRIAEIEKLLAGGSDLPGTPGSNE